MEPSTNLPQSWAERARTAHAATPIAPVATRAARHGETQATLETAGTRASTASSSGDIQVETPGTKAPPVQKAQAAHQQEETPSIRNGYKFEVTDNHCNSGISAHDGGKCHENTSRKCVTEMCHDKSKKSWSHESSKVLSNSNHVENRTHEKPELAEAEIGPQGELMVQQKLEIHDETLHPSTDLSSLIRPCTHCTRQRP